jgi:NADPH-dependent curcumin reductase CurA
MTGFGVSKVVDSSHPDFKAGDYVWGMTGWEECPYRTQFPPPWDLTADLKSHLQTLYA